MKMPIHGFLIVLTTVSMYTCGLWEQSPRDYYTSVFKNENVDMPIIKNNDGYRDYFRVIDTALYIGRKRLGVNVSGIPSVGDTLLYTDTANRAREIYFYDEKIEKYILRITGIPFDTEERPNVPYESKELVDSMAFHIDCCWGNNSYSGEVHARKYTVYVVD